MDFPHVGRHLRLQSHAKALCPCSILDFRFWIKKSLARIRFSVLLYICRELCLNDSPKAETLP